ncbi:hypothetical protein [Geminocystis sp. NIES-3709]|uniref:hypothetical protein n=1 Tax=Geminocystis sp. NIES-3709 TaxID=1617448 RepID=UPI0005FC98E4|nr:hypothetical protein [Geminocystis sp. NIES-3709]BAQ66163.1 hypothetical protein GM3709_2928 [Geminocystis sp. NIES-3709]
MIPCFYLDFDSSPPLSDNRISEEIVAEAIADVVKLAHYQGQSLDDLVEEVLQEDPILDQVQRQWLSKIVTQAWKSLT